MSNAVESLIRGAVTKGVMSVAAFNRSRMQVGGDGEAYLTGVHTPMTDELSLTDLEVIGAIPADLDGRYIRIGPNPVTMPEQPSAYHWFTGDGMVHGVRLKDGKALWYRNRWIRSSKVSKALGEPDAPGPHGLFDTVNTNVLGHAGRTWALVEAGGTPVRLDEELNTEAFDPFGGTLKKGFTAHPHTDPDTGEMHAICYFGPEPETIYYVVVNTDGKVRREEPISVQDGPSIHDCMITKRFAIILDLPVTFSMKRLMAGYAFPYAWNPKHQARIGLFPREGTADDIIWCDVDPCYVFHPSNAFDTADGKVIFDACVHDTMFDVSTAGPDSQKTPFERWTIDPVTRTVDRKVVDETSQEFPRPNETLIGKPYRYAYAMALGGGLAGQGEPPTQLFKHDLEAGTRQVHDFGAGRMPGEFVFVPRVGGLAEDDGWLMGYVLDRAADRSELVILNAQRFEAEPVARIRMPHRIPPGFHGNWVPSA
jgi:8'-apo-carotenoid 13,14-cleaving dioxygenase